MTKHVAVNPKDHKNVVISQEKSAAMGDNAMASFTFPDEFRKVQNEYAILFQLNSDRDEFTCLAMLGFENGENLYLEDKKWGARYIPMAMEVHPFLIGRSEKDPDQRSMVIDMESPRLTKGEGERLFDDQGQATPYLDRQTQRLSMLDRGYQQSKHYIEVLRKYDLLEPLAIDVALNDGSKNRLVGFHTIHEEKFQNLETGALEELQSTGFLMPTYMVLASLSNLNALVARKNAVTMSR